MLLKLPKLLTPEEVQAVLAIAETGRFEDGRTSAGDYLHGLKRNLQFEPSGPAADQLNGIVLRALVRSHDFNSFAVPRRFITPRISRYETGMGYGPHIDQVIMGEGDPIRSDLSLTLFLNDAADYDGGVLVLDTPAGRQEAKFDAGDAVCYATTMHHQVTEVTRGVRLVVVMWIQSFVPDVSKRQILHDLRTAKNGVRERNPGSPEAELLIRTHANLLRMWSEG